MPMDDAAALHREPAVAAGLPAIVTDGKRPLLPLEVRGLVYRAGVRNLIDELDLTLRAGPLSVIMGPNGAGKSLLLRLLHGLLPPSGGEIRWHDAAGQGEDVRRRQALGVPAPGAAAPVGACQPGLRATRQRPSQRRATR